MMKKLLLSAAILVAISFASCKKIYQCECTWNSGSLQGQKQTIQTADKVSKKDAEAWCQESDDGLSNATCELL